MFLEQVHSVLRVRPEQTIDRRGGTVPAERRSVELPERIVAKEAKIGEAPGMAREAIDPVPLVRARLKRFVDDPFRRRTDRARFGG
jgi:hypothetical protein